MSAPSPAHATDHGSPKENKFHLLVKMAMVLAVITGLEVLTIYLPLPKGVIVTALLVMLSVKFTLGIYLFMHLKWDKVFCTILFLIGLILALGIALALLAMFKNSDSVPLTSQQAASATVAHALRVG